MHPEKYARPAKDQEVTIATLSYLNADTHLPPTEQELRAFVGPNADYYLKKWAPALGNPYADTGFNLAAFFLCGLWLPFRKMYRVTIIFWSVMIAESLLEEVIFVNMLGRTEAPLIVARLVGLFAAVLTGKLGNYWYLNHAKRMIAQARNDYPDEATRLTALAKRGGRSLLTAIGFIVTALVLIVGLFWLLELALGH